jgi:hypothetical protein
MARFQCRNSECPHSESTDDNNFRGARVGNGPERVACKACGAEALPEDMRDAILPAPPARPIKEGVGLPIPDSERY